MTRTYGFPVDSARLKFERAIKHADELRLALAKFRAAEPYKIGSLRRPDIPGVLFYYLAKADEIPFDVPIVCGDILQNLRSALDHLAGQLVYAAGNTPDRNTAFPVSDTGAKYKAESARKIQLMRRDAINSINATEPYKGGKGEAIWRLHRLNNIDKHNLIFTTFANVTAIDAFAHLAQFMPFLQPLADAGIILRPNKPNPLQEGSILWTTIDSGAAENPKFSIEVSFGEPGICEGEPVLLVVKDLAEAVDNVLKNFASLLYFDVGSP